MENKGCLDFFFQNTWKILLELLKLKKSLLTQYTIQITIGENLYKKLGYLLNWTIFSPFNINLAHVNELTIQWHNFSDEISHAIHVKLRFILSENKNIFVCIKTKK